MKKSISLISIFLLTILCAVAYAAENTGSVEGTVVLEFTVTKEGKVRDPKVIKSVPSGVFDEAALEEVIKIRFKPHRERGEAVESVISYPMRFKMSENEFEAYKAGREGIKHLRNEEYSRALSYANAAISLSSENGRYYELRAQVYQEMKDYQKALEDYSEAIAKDPGMFHAYFGRGQVSQKLGKYSEAIDDLTRAIELNEDSVDAYNNRAALYNKLKDTKNMCMDLRKACELGDCRGLEITQNAGKCDR